MKRRYQRTLSIPAYREFREAIKRGDLGKWLIDAGEDSNAGSVKVKYTLKNKPWIVEVIVRHNYGFRRN